MERHIVKIKTTDALSAFDGSVAQLAAFFAIKPAAVYQWGEFVPQMRAYQLRETFPDLPVITERDNQVA